MADTVPLDRRVRALELRKQGLSYREIAQKTGYASAASARRAVLSLLRRVLREPAEAVRDLELARLDKLLQSLWPRAVFDGDLGAVDRILAIMRRRAELLGLDAPRKTELSATLTGTLIVNVAPLGDGPPEASNE